MKSGRGRGVRGRRPAPPGGRLATLHAYLRKQRVRRMQPGVFQRLGWSVIRWGAIAAVLWFGGTWALRVLLFDNPRYNLAHIDLDVVGAIPRQQVLEWAQVPPSVNIILLDIGKVHGRLASQSAVGLAEVRRVFPNRLMIRVTERRPMARLLTTGGVAGESDDVFYLIDRQGMVMRPRPGEDFRHLPEIKGADLVDVTVGTRVRSVEVFAALNLLTLIEGSPIRAEFDRMSVDVAAADLLEAHLGRDAQVFFSPDSKAMPEQLRRLEVILSYCQRWQRRLGTADLTVERNVPVTFAAAGGVMP